MMNLFHGTTYTNYRNIIANGFENRPIMFSDKKDEAIKYAKSYSSSKSDYPVLLKIDMQFFRIMPNKEYKLINSDYRRAIELAKSGLIDGVQSDSSQIERCGNYYVIFNIEKLNEVKNNIVTEIL